MDNTNEFIAQKVTDLTDSLYRTTDVLTSADRMIDHYRDLNREQEHEIAKVYRPKKFEQEKDSHCFLLVTVLYNLRGMSKISGIFNEINKRTL